MEYNLLVLFLARIKTIQSDTYLVIGAYNIETHAARQEGAREIRLNTIWYNA